MEVEGSGCGGEAQGERRGRAGKTLTGQDKTWMPGKAGRGKAGRAKVR